MKNDDLDLPYDDTIIQLFQSLFLFLLFMAAVFVALELAGVYDVGGIGGDRPITSTGEYHLVEGAVQS